MGNHPVANGDGLSGVGARMGEEDTRHGPDDLLPQPANRKLVYVKKPLVNRICNNRPWGRLPQRHDENYDALLARARA